MRPSPRVLVQIANRSLSEHWKTTHYSIVPRENDPRWKDVDMTRYAEEYDVAIVGGGPAGLAAAIRLKQLAADRDRELRVCVVEKAAEFGLHTLSGAVIETWPLDKLIPDWRDKGAPIKEKVKTERLAYFTEKSSLPIPLMRGNPLHNQGNYIVRLGRVVSWLAEQAEQLEVELYPGTPAQEVLYHDDGSVAGIATADFGVAKDGSPKDMFERGMELRARCTIFAEGCRGHLTKAVGNKLGLHKNSQPMSYGIGLKELWLVEEKNHRPGHVDHSVGWPLPFNSYGGSFLYHMLDDGQPMVSLGFVVGLDYSNPYVNPYQLLQQYKTHPSVAKVLEGGERIGYGARALNEGGIQTLPQLSFPGGCLVGCGAGLLTVPKLKGVHQAINSGMVAAESIFETLLQEDKGEGAKKTEGLHPANYYTKLSHTRTIKELKAMRNIRPSFNTKLGMYGGFAYSGLFYILGRGMEPWTLSYHGVYEFTTGESGQQRLQINAQNCIHCKTCDIKDATQNINWVCPEPGGGPAYDGL